MSETMEERRRRRQAEEYKEYSAPHNCAQRELDYHWTLELARRAERAWRCRRPDEHPERSEYDIRSRGMSARPAADKERPRKSSPHSRPSRVMTYAVFEQLRFVLSGCRTPFNRGT